MSDKFDVVIVGGGPAGSSSALRAAELGLSVVVLERCEFPRDKHCGGGLTPRCMSLLWPACSEVYRDLIFSVRLEFGGSTILWESDAPVMATIERSELDSALMSLAAEAGAVVVHGARAERVDCVGDGPSVLSSVGVWRGRWVIGADGIRGSTRSAIGCAPPKTAGAVFTRIEAAGSDAPGTMIFDFRVCRRGYGWIFPKGDHLNVGVYSASGLSRNLAAALDMLVKSHGLSGRRSEGPFAYSIPRAGGRSERFAGGRVLLAGDAAGVADAVTGEGIRQAVESGRLAAEAIALSADAGGDAGEIYVALLRERVLPGLTATRRAGSLFYSVGARAAGAALRLGAVRRLVAAFGPWGEYGASGGRLTVTPGSH